ncbi:uncharacterized protein LOC119733073 [Patiria miniata]|uniref:DNA methylase N-4/N-6 domain-containing protein n=1 Tax=Patiria miniata TaxID=46514 RepID=A0A914AFS7_PATMI|nr:uncharacterized protein LOC119733073 [Patiria miniata]
MDVLKLDDNIMQQRTQNFSGFHLAILDFPETWTVTDLQRFCIMLRYINVQLSTLTHYNIVCLCSLSQQAEIHRVLSSETFCKVEHAFYRKGSVQEDNAPRSVLQQDVGALVCGFWSASGRVSTDDQLTRPRSNFFDIKEPWTLAKTDNGSPVNVHQKPLQLLQDIVDAMSPKQGWVLDACSGTGTGIVACLLGGRNCVAVELEESQAAHVTRRLTSLVFPKE